MSDNFSDPPVRVCRDSFPEKDERHIQAYEEDSLIWRGSMPASEARARGLCLTDGPPPPFPVAKLADGRWERVIAIIDSNGNLRLSPDRYCDACVLFFTREEWAARSKPAFAGDSWNFATETWEDRRSLAELKAEAERRIKLFARNLEENLEERDKAEERAHALLEAVRAQDSAAGVDGLMREFAALAGEKGCVPAPEWNPPYADPEVPPAEERAAENSKPS
jgi:hypothetical protein